MSGDGYTNAGLLLNFSSMPSETDKWGWKHVSIYGGFDKGGGTKRWKCNHCNLRYNGSYSRVRAHLLGFTGAGVKSCPAVDSTLREEFQVLEEERSRKKKTTPGGRMPSQRVQTSRQNLTFPYKEDVDNIVARFFIADGSNLYGVNSPYFHDMVKAIAAFGPGYEPPTANAISTSFLNKERVKIDRYMALLRESWSHTGCTALCIGHAHSTLGYLRIDILMSSPRGLVFLKQVDQNCTEELDSFLAAALSDVIEDVGPSNVFQIISHLDHHDKYFSSLTLQKYPHIFWSPCTSHSIRTLIEEIAEFDSMKPIILCTREIEQRIMSYQPAKCMLIENTQGDPDPLSSMFAPSYSFVQKIFELKQSLQEVVVSEGWKQWKLPVLDDMQNVESAILGDEYWNSAHLFLKLCEPFIKSLSKYNVDKFVMGDAFDWWIQAFEALKIEGIDGNALNQIDQLVESKWDVFFSPLHAAGYILNPQYFGKGQSKDKIVMRGWKVTLEKYQSEITGRRVLREQLSSYWRSEGSFGDEDAIDCRDKIDPVAWWENFGFETPELQALAVKVLSQVSNVESCRGIWQNDDFPNCKTSNKFGVERREDLLFVKNNLRLSVLRNGITNPLSGQKNINSDTSPGFKKLDIAHIDQANEIRNIHDKL